MNNRQTGLGLPWFRGRSPRSGCEVSGKTTVAAYFLWPTNAIRSRNVKLQMVRSMLRAATGIAIVAVSGCASVTSHVTVFDPTVHYQPTQLVVILLAFPSQPHVNIALIEAEGTAGGSEAQLLDVAREKAQALGADALVRLEVISAYQPPVPVFFGGYGGPTYWGCGYPYGPYYYLPYYGPYPPGSYGWTSGGMVQTLKAIAIKYTSGVPAGKTE